MDDYARATAAGRSITIGGKDYRVGKLTPRGMGDLQAFFKDSVPDPRIRARSLMEGLPEAVQIHIWDGAVAEAKDWPPAFDSTEGLTLILSAEGQARFLWVMLRQHNPGLTLEAARLLARDFEMDVATLNHFMELASPGEIGDPKAPATAAGT